MKYLSFFILMIILLGFSSASICSKRGDIVITVRSCKSDRGKIMIALYNSSDTYMREKRALRKKVVKISNQTAQIHFEGLPYGNYAFVLFHDENSNLKFDKNIVGVPKEGYGFSNNARGTFGPPSFEKSRFTLATWKYKTEVSLQYLLR